MKRVNKMNEINREYIVTAWNDTKMQQEIETIFAKTRVMAVYNFCRLNSKSQDNYTDIKVRNKELNLFETQ